MRRQRIESRRFSTIASRPVGVLAIDVVVVHGLLFAIPFNRSDMPMALIEVVVGEQSAVVAAGAVDPKTIQGIPIER